MNQVILVTGGTGFAGSHLVELLVAQSAGEVHVTQFSSSEKNTAPGFNTVTTHAVDLTDAEATEALIEVVRPTQIYHLASFAYVGKSFEKGAEVLHNNVALQFNLLNAVKKYAPAARVVVVGSAEEYGMSVDDSELPITENHPFRPVNPYAVSKITQDMLAYSYFQSYNMNIIRVRPFNHIGERQTGDFAVPAFARQIVAIERGEKSQLRVGNLTGIRDFTYVKDMVAAYILVMEKGLVGEVYNVGTGTGTSMQKIVDELRALATVPIQIEVDNALLRPLDIPEIVANNDKVTALGWQPKVSVQESLAKVVEYWRTL